MNEHTEDSYAVQKAARWVAYADRLIEKGDGRRARWALLTALDTITRRLHVLTRKAFDEADARLQASELMAELLAEGEQTHRLAYATRRALRYQP